MKRTLLLLVPLCALFVIVAGRPQAQSPRAAVTTPPDVKAPPADAKQSFSGLAWKVLKQGTGTEHPGLLSTVTVHYSGWTTDGKLFDSSVGGAPATFQLNGVIAGWGEGVRMMVAGEKRRFWIPGPLAYDKSGDPMAPKGMLVFDIELISFR